MPTRSLRITPPEPAGPIMRWPIISHSLDLKSDQPAVLDSMAQLEWKQGRQADALAAWQLAVKRLAAEMDSAPCAGELLG